MASNKDEIKSEVNQVLHGYCPSHWYNHLDEVYPGIFIGDGVAAESVNMLEAHGITHILNVAAYISSALHYHEYETVHTNQEWYDAKNYRCTFKGFEVIDVPSFPLSKYFEEAAEFIESALASNGKILVHCYVGMSRSATFVTAYLMIKKQMRAKDAIALIRENRACHPNRGFVDKLADLELQLRASQ